MRKERVQFPRGSRKSSVGHVLLRDAGQPEVAERPRQLVRYGVAVTRGSLREWGGDGKEDSIGIVVCSSVVVK